MQRRAALAVLALVLCSSAPVLAEDAPRCSGVSLLTAAGDVIGEATVLEGGLLVASSCRDQSQDERIAFAQFGGEFFKTSKGEIVISPAR